MIRGMKFSHTAALVMVFLFLDSSLGDARQSGPMSVIESPNMDLAGRQLMIRVYNDWQTDPKAYKLISVPLSGSWFSFDAVRDAFPGIKDSAAIVVSGREQKDKAVAAMMGDSLFAEPYEKGKRLSIRPSRSVTKGSTEWFITDALGLPIPKASVDISVRGGSDEDPHLYLHTATADDQGRLEIPALNGKLRYLSFIISEENYGVSLVSLYVNAHRELITPLVSKATEAYERSIHGIVMDPEGNAVAGAVIECYNIRTLGEGLINSLHDWSNKSLTDEKGAFSLYLPNENIRDERGYLVPPKSKYNVRIEAPKELGLLPYVKPIENGRETLVFLESGERFRTFIFEDANGPMTDPRKLQYISLTINRPDGSRVSLGYEDFKDGGIFSPGEYHAVRRGMDEFDFEPLTVNEQSPDELIFRLPENILYLGQIVHGLTGEPMEGAFVIGYQSKSKGNLSMITDEQWRALHALPDEPELTDPAVKPICDIYGVKKIVRTDEQGRFQMSFLPGEIYGFIAFDQDYLGLQHRRHALIPDENRQAEIPVMKLYPAATVLIELHTGATHISIWPRWIIDENENSVWVREFLATDDRRESMFTYDAWIEQNKAQSFHVPAGLNLRVKLDTPYDEQFCPIEIPQVIHLAQGQVLDLGRHQFKSALEVYVQVTNSQGRAIEGVPVRMLLRDSNTWSVAHNTDESGIARFHVAPNSQGQFGVSYHGEGGLFLKETTSYQIGGDEDSGRQFTLRLSDEVLDLLFKSDGLLPLKP
ncbi:MAG TPA: carboxypeptidase-like regulatory domain-containing protein [Sedimentisphaerales bacterium]|nr:carboxypeptidase-like regulatory domain-containing protein [Sedimentisphaerales bacterium]